MEHPSTRVETHLIPHCLNRHPAVQNKTAGPGHGRSNQLKTAENIFFCCFSPIMFTLDGKFISRSQQGQIINTNG